MLAGPRHHSPRPGTPPPAALDLAIARSRAQGCRSLSLGGAASRRYPPAPRSGRRRSSCFDSMLYLTIFGGAFIAWLILVVLFTPAIPYHIEADVDSTSDHFIHVLESACQTTLQPGNRVEILTNGAAFYPAMVEAIKSARETVNMECYIFKTGGVADQFIEALSERARAGVRVTLVMDAIGSFGAIRRSARRLREAGCRV